MSEAELTDPLGRLLPGYTLGTETVFPRGGGTGSNIPDDVINAINLAKQELPSNVIPNAPSNQAAYQKVRLEDLAKARGMTPRELGERFSGLAKPGVPYEDWEYTFRPGQELLPQKTFDVNQLKKGDIIYPLVGDMTDAGRIKTSILGNNVSIPMEEGGPNYMRANPGKVWASGKGVVSDIEGGINKAVNLSRELNNTDPSVYGMTVSMRGDSGDFSTHSADAILGMLPQAKITKSAAKKFDEFMRQPWGDNYPATEDWPGINSPKLKEYLEAPSMGEVRKKFAKGMDAATFRDLGFPSVGAARFSTIDPNIAHLPSETTGYSVGKFLPENFVNHDPSVVHRSYPSEMLGSYEGGLAAPLMRDEIFQSFSNAYDKQAAEKNLPANRLVNAKKRAFGMRDDAYQIVDPQYQDYLGKLIEQKIKEGFKEGGEVDGDEDIVHALRLATGGRAHFDDGGDVRGGDNPGGLSGDTGAYAFRDVGPEQGAVNAATAAAENAQQTMREWANNPTASSFSTDAPATTRSIQEASPTSTAIPLSAGVDPADTAMAKQVLGQQKQEAFNAAQAQANAVENRLQGMEMATAPSLSATTFGANNGIVPAGSFVPLGAAPGTVAAEEVSKLPFGINPNDLKADISQLGQKMPSTQPTDFSKFGQLGFNAGAAGTPLASLAAAEPQHYEPLGNQITSNQNSIVSDALMKAATFEPSKDAALRAARDAITQDMGKPETSYPAPVAQKVSGFGSSSPADLPASSTPTTSVSSQNILDKIFGSTQDQIDKLAAAGQYAGMDKQQYADQFAGGDINAVKERIINQDGQQKVDYYTKDLSQALFGDPLKAISTGIGNLFAPKPSYDPTAIGNGMGNIQGVSPSNNMTSPFGGHGGGPQQVLAGPVAAPAAATPAAAPVVPGTPVPFTYAKRTPYLDYGAYGAGIGNVAPISYRDPINWALVPGYRATGGRVGENNALANAIRLLAMQNRS